MGGGVRYVCASERNPAHSFRAAVAITVGVALATLTFADRAQAIEFGDGLVEIHGFYQMETRALIAKWDTRNAHLSQWAHTLNIEAEFDLAPDGFGPFSLIQAYARVSARFDCVWYQACWTIRSFKYFGQRADRAPPDRSDGRRSGATGILNNPAEPQVRVHRHHGADSNYAPRGGWRLIKFQDIPPLDSLLGIGGPGTQESLDKTIKPVAEHSFAVKHIQGALGPELFIQPWIASERIEAIGALASVGSMGSTAFPVPIAVAPLRLDSTTLIVDTNADTIPDTAAGGLRPAQDLFTPSRALLKEKADFDSFDQNFTQSELAWNRGASQQQTKELKEAYFDIEMFDGSLFLRLGRQTVVWGKTELFRAQDQFNPQDLALSTLPSLEDSRIPLWAARAIWSLYDVGPLEDVRIEVAANLDHYEPADLGRCGEPYTIFVACAKTIGLLAHGILGIGLAGEKRPPNFYDNPRGLEFGARVEFRWGRFSFAISDFYGYDDFPTANFFHGYERNVDPISGRPRVEGASGRCLKNDPGDTDNDGIIDDFAAASPACLTPNNVTTAHPGNRQFFDVVCSASVGIVRDSLGELLSPGDPLFKTACAFDVFNAQDALLGSNLPSIISLALTADLNWNTGLKGVFALALGLDVDGDMVADAGAIPPAMATFEEQNLLAGNFTGLSDTLSHEQQALLGCGAFYFQDDADFGASGACHIVGFDLFNMEGNVFFQAFPQVEMELLGLSDERPVGTRGSNTILPGARGPFDSGYDPKEDGCIGDFTDATFTNLLMNPPDGSTGLTAGQIAAIPHQNQCNGFNAQIAASTGVAFGAGGYLEKDNVELILANNAIDYSFLARPFRSELDLVSFNAMMILAGASPAIDENDPANGCLSSVIAFPDNLLNCTLVRAFVAALGVQRPERRAGGRSGFGRRDFSWLSGGEIYLSYEKRNVFGFAMDFAEDYTKSNWGIEFVWFEDAAFASQKNKSLNTRKDQLSLTVSIDRPTFINFLNANRTFFFNTQWFVRYIPSFDPEDMTVDGPVSVLGTFTFFTGFYQDRLIWSSTFVHDVTSASGGQIIQMVYRLSEVFSISVGMTNFYGDPKRLRIPTSQASTDSTTGNDFTTRSRFPAITPVADREEVFFSLRYTF